MNKYLLLIIIILTASCDCVQNVQGTIIDSESNTPIADARIYNKKKINNKTTSDSKGEFELSSISGGFKCPPMTIIIESENYIQFETTIEAGGQKNIKLHKITK